MSQIVTTNAAAQSLVSFSINLPADIAKRLVAIAAAESENSGEPRTPEQIAAIGIASLVECGLAAGEYLQVDHGFQAHAFRANAAEVHAETAAVSFNLPADVSALFVRAAKAWGRTPQQHAAIAAASHLSADTEYFEAEFSKAEFFDHVQEEARLIAANTPGA